MATGAASMVLQYVFNGSISIHDIEIERRPYHRNCGCALHNLKGVCPNACPKQVNLLFARKQSWNDCSLSQAASKSSSQSSSLSDMSARNRRDTNLAVSQR